MTAAARVTRGDGATRWDRADRLRADPTVSPAWMACPLPSRPLIPTHDRGAGQSAPVHGLLPVGRARVGRCRAVADRAWALARLRRPAGLPAGHDGADHVHPRAGGADSDVRLRLPGRRQLLLA